MNYMICDQHGTALSDGHSELNYARVAQDMANRLGETVYAYGPDDTDETAEPFAPKLEITP